MTTAIETITFDVAMDELLERIRDDYRNWGKSDEMTPTQIKMVEKFNNGLRIEEGRKYIKVITGTCVWGFIVKKDGGKFRAGAILKAASWSAPATNAARGNIFDESYTIRWTGPLYL